MAKSKASPSKASAPPEVKLPPPTVEAKSEYTVVARRYRPQQFNELIGQEHVAKSLVNALQSDRVAHADLFTGARGVGKTSAARILAKALNCVAGPTPTPCDRCESCLAIAAGEDVDVLEIDGASNNKVEEIRDLRQNVGFRPTRSRYKIYIIDEVHMLSASAFNALLKTLEEPPAHVKFIFATTEVQKIPITILSRCQRFDFANVGPIKIFELLKLIVAQEGHEADEDALRLIARRAGGSMRDSHSLLDQLLASSSGRLTVEKVHAITGSAGDERVSELAAAILKHDAKAALELVSAWFDQGLQVSELIEQMIGYWRALMLVNCGGPDIRELPVLPGQKQAIIAQAKHISLDSILAGLEVWTTTRSRIRDSVLAPVLLEMAVVRLARLENLVPLGQLVQAVVQAGNQVLGPVRQLNAPVEAGASAKKNDFVMTTSPSGNPAVPIEKAPLPFNEGGVAELWRELIQYLSEKSPILSNQLKTANLPAIFGPNTLVIRFPAGYNHSYETCATEGNTSRIQDAIQKLTGQAITVRLELDKISSVAAASQTSGGASIVPVVERRKQLMSLPLFRKANESLGAQIWHMDEEFNPAAPPRPTPSTPLDPDEN
jgi:DNA polymerase-3 subunit gamma/tau